MMLHVDGLRSGYGRVPVLNGVSLSVTDGEISEFSAITAWARQRCCAR